VLRQEERGFSFSDPSVGVFHQFLALPDEALRRLPQCLRTQSHFGWNLRAPVEVRADVLSEILPAPRAHVRPVSERIGGEFHDTEVEATGQALGNDVIRAVDEDQGALVRSQCSGSATVHVRHVCKSSARNAGS
jgi:hypothetical protein